ncbi:adenine phosphoribosyltransferase [Parvicella tangerina]|uniref:Adenine phosphoribosyltransferase n=1 Tax=Parvicella tangerina TaxID=2829795 RepID=A0A916JL31_9FLAO|nr:adenine phosphoribosyltransferase [Parvicella tangerina]CAG5078137.1 Adenine phosphoribosyltransferase [Parvicella tangerina]
MSLQERIDQTIRNVPDFPKPGIQFKDITPILEDPKLSEEVVAAFAQFWKGKVDAIAGVESRGFLFGFPLAMQLNVPFILIRKKGKLPYQTVSYKYDLEYGSAEIEMHVGAVKDGMNVLIHDDLLATGGTAGAAAELIKKEGGKVAGFSFLVELEFLKGADKLSSYSDVVQRIVSY